MKLAVCVLMGFGGALVLAPPRGHDAPTPTAAASTAPAGYESSSATAKTAARAAKTPTSKSVRALDLDLNYLLTSKVRGGRWGVIVVSLTRGDTLYSRSADELMQPASTLKLFTTGLALDQFGPNYQIGTDVLRDSSLDPSGTLHGNLYLRGGGDPALSTRFLGTATSPMDNLARAIVAAGIKHVSGDIVADASAFDDQPIPDGWKRRYLSAAYAAPVSALSLNENVVWVAVSPGARRGEIALEPASTAFSVTDNVTLRSASSGGSVAVYRRGEGELEVRGWIGTRASTQRYSVVVDDPPRFAAGALRASLATFGVTVDGQLREGVTPLSATPVASLQSPPLAQIVSQMNRESINHVAELLFRDAARSASPNHVGSAAAGEIAL
ncbi:MAG TPA: D-alanyl-D-alanine carboxypeptidase/D-alanyl-D-alanine-endopeptidase, partial [Gemmatimonadaceae bacterium]